MCSELHMIARELDRLISAYSAPQRHYHDIRHIDATLRLSLAHRSDLSDATAVDLALLFHDVVYEPSRHDNEAASASMARASLGAVGFAPALTDKVARYIEATRHIGSSPIHGVIKSDGDLDHLLDFDLAVLAAAPTSYDEYASAIRREYACYSDAAYRQGRAHVLAKLLAMPALYRVPALAAAWEPKARANLSRELAALQAR